MLSILQPSVRSFRIPFTVGALWLIAALLLLVPGPDVIDFMKNISKSSDAIALAALTILAAYVVGLVVLSLLEWLAHSEPGKDIWHRINTASPDWITRQRFVSAWFTEDYLGRRAREHFASYHSSVQELARALLISEVELAGISLLSKSPEQYQEYDRIRGEAQFFIGSSAPVLMIIIYIGVFTDHCVTLTIVAVIVSMSLALQGLDRWKMADQRLASAIYLGLVRTPLFDDFLKEFRRRARAHSTQGAPNPGEPEEFEWSREFLRARRLDSFLAFLADQPEASA